MATFRHRTLVDTLPDGSSKPRVVVTEDPDLIERLRNEKTGGKEKDAKGRIVDVFAWDETDYAEAK